MTGALQHIDNLHMEWHGEASYRSVRDTYGGSESFYHMFDGLLESELYIFLSYLEKKVSLKGKIFPKMTSKPSQNR